MGIDRWYNWGGGGCVPCAAGTGSDRAGDQASLHNDGSTSIDHGGGGHWATGQSGVGG